MSKIGQFDWIVEFKDLREILFNEIHEYFNVDKLNDLKVLDVGCGTSSLPLSLVTSGFGRVIAIDKDVGCIQHMSEMYSSYEQLEWLVHDILEIPSINSDSRLSDESFDVIIDKATLDYMIAEGPVAAMLHNIHRMLKRNGGIYLICSAHEETFLVPFFSITSPQFPGQVLQNR